MDNENEKKLLYPVLELHEADLRERDYFNQRRGEIKGSIECINKDQMIYSKKVKKFQRQSRALNWINIVTGNVSMLTATGIGITTSILTLNPVVIGIVIGVMSGFEAIKSLSLFTTVKIYCQKQKAKYIMLRDLANQYRERLYIYSQNALDDNKITLQEVQTAIAIYSEYRQKRDQLLDADTCVVPEDNVNTAKALEKILKESKLSNSAKEKIKKELLEKDLREKLGLVDKPKEYAATLNLQSSAPSAPPYT